jgi:gluconokinase
MGVSGSGKSYLASRLAAATGWQFAEGDDYHSDAMKARMHAGIPLTDEDRAPWLDRLHGVLVQWQQAGASGILTCSALKAAYRDRLTAGLAEIRFIWMDPPRTVLADRLAHRAGHFMSPALLDSQIATLQPPASDPHTLRLDGSQPVDEEVAQILTWLHGPDLA